MSEMITWPGGEWKTVRLIGKGGFGAVYEIQREEFGKVYKAAMKVMRIPPDASEVMKMMDEGMSREDVSQYYTDYVKRLSEEFALLSTLKGYTNIVSYEDHRILRDPDGISWTILIRMELLTPVNEYFRAHRLNEEAVVKLGSDICHALAICHERNIIHRDIKLDNIFVNERGDFELGDFGIARISEETMSTMTMTGTPGYMAPEVLRKERYGQTVDIYSLGIAMYMLLNKKRGPFYPIDRRLTPGDRESALNARMSGKTIPEPFYGSKRLKEAILKAIAFKPEDRYRTAEEFRKAFTQAEKEDPFEGLYNQALQQAQKARSWNDYEKAEFAFGLLGDYKDSRMHAERCRRESERLKEEEERRKETERVREAEKVNLREGSYQQALGLEGQARTRDDFVRAEAAFGILGDYKDCPERAARCRREAERLKREETVYGEAERYEETGKYTETKGTSRNRKPFIMAGAVGIVILAAAGLMLKMNNHKEKAVPVAEETATQIPTATPEPTATPVPIKNRIQHIAESQVGDIVTFGKYEQDNDTSNGKEDIEWIVLDKEDDQALLLSKYVLDVIPYDEECVDVTWETCTLRSWLKGAFADTAFEFEKEQNAVLTTQLQNEKNSKYGTAGGSDTDDKVFCLSITEAEQYFESDEARLGFATDYAIAQGIYVNDDTKASLWWLRSPGNFSDCAAFVRFKGSVGASGNPVSYHGGVRPALWINLES